MTTPTHIEALQTEVEALKAELELQREVTLLLISPLMGPLFSPSGVLGPAGVEWETRKLEQKMRDDITKTKKGPTCKYCGNPVDKEGQIHAGGCGNIG